MDFTGILHNIQIDYRSRKPVISFLVDQDPNGLDELQKMQLSIKVGKHRKKRSLDSNAYFHVLCDKLRLKIGISMAACKNDLITSYGQVWYLDETEPLIYKTNAPPEFMAQREEVHMKFVKVGDDGAYWYRMYRGSHTYDSYEMAKLIEGTVYECKQQQIEVATPEELAKMANLWEQQRRRYDKAGR